MNKLDSEAFCRIWELSGSLTEVSVKLVRLGHADFSPRKSKFAAHILRRMGVKLKVMPESSLPDYVDLSGSEEETTSIAIGPGGREIKVGTSESNGAVTPEEASVFARYVSISFPCPDEKEWAEIMQNYKEQFDTDPTLD